MAAVNRSGVTFRNGTDFSGTASAEEVASPAELDVLTDILSHAERVARIKKAARMEAAHANGTTHADLNASISGPAAAADGTGNGHGSASMAGGGVVSPSRKSHPLTLVSLLAVYEPVLRKHGVSPSDDTRYHDLLLRLQSGDSDPNWWTKLTNERHRSQQFDVACRHCNRALQNTALQRWKAGVLPKYRAKRVAMALQPPQILALLQPPPTATATATVAPTPQRQPPAVASTPAQVRLNRSGLNSRTLTGQRTTVASATAAGSRTSIRGSTARPVVRLAGAASTVRPSTAQPQPSLVRPNPSAFLNQSYTGAASGSGAQSLQNSFIVATSAIAAGSPKRTQPPPAIAAMLEAAAAAPSADPALDVSELPLGRWIDDTGRPLATGPAPRSGGGSSGFASPPASPPPSGTFGAAATAASSSGSNFVPAPYFVSNNTATAATDTSTRYGPAPAQTRADSSLILMEDESLSAGLAEREAHRRAIEARIDSDALAPLPGTATAGLIGANGKAKDISGLLHTLHDSAYGHYLQLGRFFRIWKNSFRSIQQSRVDAAAEKRNTFTALTHWKRSVCVSVMRGWSWVVADRLKRYTHFVSRHEFRTKRRVMAEWLQRRNDRVAVRTKIRLWQVARLFVPWRSVALYRYSMKKRLLSHQNKRKDAIRAHYFRSWFHQTHERVFWRTADARVDAARRTKLIRSSFAHWYTCAYAIHQFKRAEILAVRLQYRRGLMRWRAWIERRKEAKLLNQRLVHARIRDIGLRCLRHWMYSTRVVLTDRDNQLRAEQSWVESHERRAVNRWKNYVSTQRMDHAQEQRAVQLYQLMWFRRAVQQFKRFALPANRRRCDSVQRQHLIVLRRVAFREWRARLHHYDELEVGVKEKVCSIRKSVYFNTWRMHYNWEQNKKQTLIAHANRQRAAKQLAAIRVLHAWAVAQKARRIAFQTVSGQKRHDTLELSWKRWRYELALCQSYKQKSVQIHRMIRRRLFARWKAQYRLTRTCRQIADVQLKFHARLALHWWSHVYDKFIKLRAATLVWRQKVMFSAWKRFTRKQKLLRSNEKLMHALRRKRYIRVALMNWMAGKAIIDRQIRAATAHRTQLLQKRVRLVFGGWRTELARVRELQRVVYEIVGAQNRVIASGVIEKWKTELSLSQRVRLFARKRVISSLRRYAVSRRRMKLANAQAVKVWARTTSKRYVRGWAVWKKFTKKMRNARHRAIRRRLNHYVSLWQDAAYNKKKRIENRALSNAHAVRGMQIAVWNAWGLALAIKRKCGLMHVQAVAHHLRTQKRSGVAAWIDFTRAKRLYKSNRIQADGWYDQRTKRSLFTRWFTNATQQQALQRMMARGKSRYVHHWVVRWRNNTPLMKRHRVDTTKADRFFAVIETRKIFRYWQHTSRMVRALRTVLAKALPAWQNPGLRKALNSWMWMVRFKHRSRLLKEKFDVSANRRLVAGTLSHWVAATRKAKDNVIARAKWHQLLARRAAVRWLAFCQIHQNRLAGAIKRLALNHKRRLFIRLLQARNMRASTDELSRAVVVPRLTAVRMSAYLSGWRAATRASVHHKKYVLRRVMRGLRRLVRRDRRDRSIIAAFHTRRFKTQIFDRWIKRTRSVQATTRASSLLTVRTSHQRMRTALRGWYHACVQRIRVKQFAYTARRRLLSRCVQWWRFKLDEVASHRAQLSQFQAHIRGGRAAAAPAGRPSHRRRPSLPPPYPFAPVPMREVDSDDDSAHPLVVVNSVSAPVTPTHHSRSIVNASAATAAPAGPQPYPPLQLMAARNPNQSNQSIIRTTAGAAAAAGTGPYHVMSGTLPTTLQTALPAATTLTLTLSPTRGGGGVATAPPVRRVPSGTAQSLSSILHRS